MSFRNTALILVLLLSSGLAAADAGYWRVEGNVLNVENNPLNYRECPMDNLRLRFFSRWANGVGCIGECPWGANWGEDTTNGQGAFLEQSYYFPDVSRQRDILIQYRSMGSWSDLTIVSDISGGTPHYVNGNVHTFDLGIIQTDRFECPTVWVPADDGRRLDDPRIEEMPHEGETKHGGDFYEGTFAELPCGIGPDGSINGPDLSFDVTQVRHRDNQPTAPMERITWEVTVHNNGPVTYHGDGHCATRVEAVYFIPELNSTRPYDVPVSGDIAPGSSRTYTQDANLGEISEESSASYNVVFTVDPDGIIPEADETNNVQPGCYTPSTEAYVESPCYSALVIPGNESASKYRIEENKR